MTKYQTTVYECDNPDCNTIRPGLGRSEPAVGYHGRTLYVDAFGGDTIEWYACGVNCIQEAVANAVQREEGSLQW